MEDFGKKLKEVYNQALVKKQDSINRSVNNLVNKIKKKALRDASLGRNCLSITIYEYDTCYFYTKRVIDELRKNGLNAAAVELHVQKKDQASTKIITVRWSNV